MLHLSCLMYLRSCVTCPPWRARLRRAWREAERNLRALLLSVPGLETKLPLTGPPEWGEAK